MATQRHWLQNKNGVHKGHRATQPLSGLKKEKFSFLLVVRRGQGQHLDTEI
jgi:hypothetical protein